MISGYFGGGLPLQTSRTKVQGDTLDWGDGGALLGASFLTFPTPYVGLGVAIAGTGFQDSEVGMWGPYGSGLRYEYKTSMALFDAMFIGRFNLNPRDSLRFYVPWGVGLTSARGEYKMTGYMLDMRFYEETHHGYTSSLGWYAGLGAELELDSLVGGLEMRYQAFEFDKSHFGIDGYSGREHYSYLSLLLSIGYKF